MSIFDDFSAEFFDQAAEIIGTVAFKIHGDTDKYEGVINYHNSSKQNDQDGMFYDVDASLICDLDQFSCCDPKQFERVYSGKRLECEGRYYRIESVSLDTISVTLNLVTQNQRS